MNLIEVLNCDDESKFIDFSEKNLNTDMTTITTISLPGEIITEETTSTSTIMLRNNYCSSLESFQSSGDDSGCAISIKSHNSAGSASSSLLSSDNQSNHDGSDHSDHDNHSNHSNRSSLCTTSSHQSVHHELQTQLQSHSQSHSHLNHDDDLMAVNNASITNIVFRGPYLAVAITNCTPCPYDREALAFKKGDLINIIAKNLSGTWIGLNMNNGKIGHFKFINVQMISDEMSDNDSVSCGNNENAVTQFDVVSCVSGLHNKDKRQNGKIAMKSNSFRLESTTTGNFHALSLTHKKKKDENEEIEEELESKCANDLNDDDVNINDEESLSIKFNELKCKLKESKSTMTLSDVLDVLGMNEKTIKREYLTVLTRNGFSELDSFKELGQQEDQDIIDALGIANPLHLKILLKAARLICEEFDNNNDDDNNSSDKDQHILNMNININRSSPSRCQFDSSSHQSLTDSSSSLILPTTSENMMRAFQSEPSTPACTPLTSNNEMIQDFTDLIDKFKCLISSSLNFDNDVNQDNLESDVYDEIKHYASVTQRLNAKQILTNNTKTTHLNNQENTLSSSISVQENEKSSTSRPNSLELNSKEDLFKKIVIVRDNETHDDYDELTEKYKKDDKCLVASNNKDIFTNMSNSSPTIQKLDSQLDLNVEKDKTIIINRPHEVQFLERRKEIRQIEVDKKRVKKVELQDTNIKVNINVRHSYGRDYEHGKNKDKKSSGTLRCSSLTRGMVSSQSVVDLRAASNIYKNTTERLWSGKKKIKKFAFTGRKFLTSLMTQVDDGHNLSSVTNKDATTTISKLLMEAVSQQLYLENIDLTTIPYTDNAGFCAIPPALVQRYADEFERDIYEMAEVFDSIRMKDLTTKGSPAVPNDYLGDSCKGTCIEFANYENVNSWLISIGLPMYESYLEKANYLHLSRVSSMNEYDLIKCGIEDKRHLRIMTNAIGALSLHFK